MRNCLHAASGIRLALQIWEIEDMENLGVKFREYFESQSEGDWLMLGLGPNKQILFISLLYNQSEDTVEYVKNGFRILTFFMGELKCFPFSSIANIDEVKDFARQHGADVSKSFMMTNMGPGKVDIQYLEDFL